MSTTAINAGNLTLLDRVKRSNPDGSIATIIEMLSKKRAIIEDAHSEPSNRPMSHLLTQRTSLPSPTYRRYNEGVTAAKSKTSQLEESMCMMNALSKVDCALAEVNGDERAFRASEELPFIEGMMNEAETGIFYNSTLSAPEKYMGLAPRLASTTGVAGSQIILADGSASGADQTSIYLIGWGPKKVYLIYPKGTDAGLKSTDMGRMLARDANNAEFPAYQTWWDWRLGLAVEDWRYIVRIANIDTGNLVATGSVIIDAMIRATHKLQSLTDCKPVFYMDRTVSTYLDLQAKTSVLQSTMSFENVGGKPVGMFRGIPCHTTDGLVDTESAIS